jgi:hypothetical protein
MLNQVALRKILWLTLAVVALVGTWAQILGYLDLGFWGAQAAFWRDTLAQPVTRFITLDILFLGTVVSYWMLAEARRLNMRNAWLYIVYSALVAISSGFPLFMYARERARERRGERESTLGAVDHVIVVMLLVFSCGHLVLSLRAAFA